jgi:hypothetical protein
MVLLNLRRENNDMMVELSVDDVSSAGNERKMGETVVGWLWFFAVNWTGTVNLC